MCDKDGVSLCNTCIQSLEPFTITEKDWVHCIFSYRDPKVRTIIHSLKFRNIQSIREQLTTVVHESILDIKASSLPHGSQKIILLPVPTLQSHRIRRGISPLIDICQIITNTHPHIYTADESSVVRVNKKAQVGLSRKERLVNMKNAFQVSPKHTLHNATVFIIDDVMTTGSTLHELREVCLRAGAKSVNALVIAH